MYLGVGQLCASAEAVRECVDGGVWGGGDISSLSSGRQSPGLAGSGPAVREDGYQDSNHPEASKETRDVLSQGLRKDTQSFPLFLVRQRIALSEVVSWDIAAPHLESPKADDGGGLPTRPPPV